jgi:hypothetical protein
MRFSELDDGEGFVEIRLRIATPNLPGEFRGELVGNEARKHFIKWVLATASSLCGNRFGSSGDQRFHEVAMFHVASADAEARTWETQS